eukprot:6203445-Pleurochrysis_carterae.AAC.2
MDISSQQIRVTCSCAPIFDCCSRCGDLEQKIPPARVRSPSSLCITIQPLEKRLMQVLARLMTSPVQDSSR